MTIYGRFAEILRDCLDPQTAISQLDTLADLGADSMDEAEILYLSEDEFDIDIDDRLLTKETTVAAAAAMIEGLMAEKQPNE